MLFGRSNYTEKNLLLNIRQNYHKYCGVIEQQGYEMGKQYLWFWQVAIY
jgi:hypothetical protein